MRDTTESSENFDTYKTKDQPKKSSKGRRDFKHSGSNKKDDRDDKLTLVGVVEEALPGTWFRVKITNGDVMVLATLSGKMRQNHIQILPGDNVTIEVSPYDTSRGRVVRRNK
jgi:translation initiation factor IF-1